MERPGKWMERLEDAPLPAGHETPFLRFDHTDDFSTNFSFMPDLPYSEEHTVEAFIDNSLLQFDYLGYHILNWFPHGKTTYKFMKATADFFFGE
jgi:hypothetical protein